MKRLQIPTSKQIWSRRESCLIEVLSLALNMLHGKKDSMPTEEDLISRSVALFIRKANEDLRKKGRHIDHLPQFQSQNQPDAASSEVSKAEKKKPDFLWEWRDSGERRAEYRYKYYAIECKRLGRPPSTFCRPYITEGVCRFINPEHAYSKYLPSGAMIGYIQSMEVKDVLAEVNKEAGRHSISTIELTPDVGKAKNVRGLEQQLDRPKVSPTPFTLRHLWVDLQ